MVSLPSSVPSLVRQCRRARPVGNRVDLRAKCGFLGECGRITVTGLPSSVPFRELANSRLSN
jgi:hypothetical protein